MKIYNPFSLIEQLKSEIEALKFENKVLKLKVSSKDMEVRMKKAKIDSFEKELNAVKKLNNKLIGEKMQLKKQSNNIDMTGLDAKMYDKNTFRKIALDAEKAIDEGIEIWKKNNGQIV